MKVIKILFFFFLNFDLAYDLFNRIIKTVYYFNLNGLNDFIRIFIAKVWIHFICFIPKNFLPINLPDILNDLMIFFFSSTSNPEIKKKKIL